MKIYPNDSNIIVTNNVNVLTDIPLSYVDTQKLEYNINTVAESDFNNKIKQEVLPYENMDKNIICLFDNFGNQINHTDLTKNFKREGDGYVFVPYGSTMFGPKMFEYNVVSKKSIIYNSKMQYNLKACVMSDSLANSLMPIFGDAPLKNIAPSNILVNNGSMSYQDLATGNLKDKDIAFINLTSPTTDELENPFNVDTFLKFKTNVFSFMSSMFSEDVTEDTIYKNEEIKLYRGKEDRSFKIKKPMIYDEVSIISDKFFTVPADKDKVKYHNLFNSSQTPILIEEHEGKGFIVYAVNDITFKTSLHSRIFYEIMFFLYAKSYVQTKQYREWIADSIPDYIVINNKLTKKDKFMSHLELHNMFGLNQYEITPYNINIDNKLYPFVKFTGLTNNYLTFEKDISDKNADYRDPVKKDGAISIFTSRQDIIYFNDFLYKIDDSLSDNIKVDRVDNSVQVTIKPFRHSSSGIYIKTVTSMNIPLSYKDAMNNNIQITNADFYIVCKQNESASYLEYIEASEYKKADGLKIAVIQIRQDETKTLVYDMRRRGGGLPEGEKDNFSCFDIGHIFGRPYRKGASLIITLPKKLEQHKQIIEDTVKQYCVAEEYPIILFKED